MGKFKVHHPTADDPPRHRSFAAFGDSDLRCSILGVLKDAQGRIVARGKTLRNPPPMWVISFQGAPPRDGLTLEITDAVTGLVLQVVGSLSVPRDDKQRFIGLTYPMPGDTIPSNFSAYGTTDDGQPVSGTIGADTEGQSQGPPDTPDWIITFTDAAGTTLTVSNGVSTPEEATDLTIVPAGFRTNGKDSFALGELAASRKETAPRETVPDGEASQAAARK